jgi:hypothetical protein
MAGLDGLERFVLRCLIDVIEPDMSGLSLSMSASEIRALFDSGGAGATPICVRRLPPPGGPEDVVRVVAVRVDVRHVLRLEPVEAPRPQAGALL